METKTVQVMELKSEYAKKWRVPSDSNPSMEYEIGFKINEKTREGELVCSCPAFIFGKKFHRERKVCRHILSNILQKEIAYVTEQFGWVLVPEEQTRLKPVCLTEKVQEIAKEPILCTSKASENVIS